MSIELKPIPVKTTGASHGRKDSIMEPSPTELGFIINRVSPPSDDEDGKAVKQWKGSASMTTRYSIIPPGCEPQVQLGSGQVQPKGYRLTSERYGELRLSILKIKGVVEVEVSFAIDLSRISIITLFM